MFYLKTQSSTPSQNNQNQIIIVIKIIHHLQNILIKRGFARYKTLNNKNHSSTTLKTQQSHNQFQSMSSSDGNNKFVKRC